MRRIDMSRSCCILALVVVPFLHGCAGDASIRVAAIQMQAEFAEVESNLAAAERLVREAFDRGAEWVILPEFFTTAIGVHPRMLDAARPLDGRPTQLLKSLAREYEGVVGGSFISIREGHSYNTFVLAFPDGSTYFHDKDYPTFWETLYYIGGEDDGVMETPAGPIGSALCWEFVRSGTAERLRGRVDMVVGGSCWWTARDDDTSSGVDARRQASLELLQETPVRFARMMGVPVAHASHAGSFQGFQLPDQQVSYNSHFEGETVIVDGHGQILARMAYEDGEGIILADVTPGQVAGPHEPIPEGFWIPELPQTTVTAWEEALVDGRKYYDEVTVLHRSGS
jgi:predicted amidohydrolase